MMLLEKPSGNIVKLFRKWLGFDSQHLHIFPVYRAVWINTQFVGDFVISYLWE